MYRKFVAPLSKRAILKLMNYYSKDGRQFPDLDDFEFCLGQLYKAGIVQTKKHIEGNNLILTISLTEAGKELWKKQESMEEAVG